ncbi:hypothetical protein CAF53_02435 [Sphingobium sp. LB126]|uniref:DUF736 family protein n=1 Tax=Sphingobium sp. LB126 TaxID=1983755 RepID=UPI000C1FD8EA|nr:DUF736 family protein [Sphingobium sp. LB126]PJG47223.1 hypothetical protein CAF53_02435 [Sphingobium sp. LB126]
MNMMRQPNSVKVGSFRKVGDIIQGWIRTFHLNVDYVQLVPAEQRSENSPSFEVWGQNAAGHLAHLGTLWPRKTQKDKTPFHGGFVDDRGAQGEMQVAVFGDLNTGADMVWRQDDFGGSGRPQSFGGGQRGGQRQGSGQRGGGFGGFSGGSTAGPNGEYVGGNAGAPFDDEVPF